MVLDRFYHGNRFRFAILTVEKQNSLEIAYIQLAMHFQVWSTATLDVLVMRKLMFFLKMVEK